MDFLFIINSVMFGIGLAMDAFSVSLANGLNEAHMPHRKAAGIAGTFAFFQFAMPMIGWFCVRTVVQAFTAFKAFIPFIALVLLLFLGGRMILEGMRHKADEVKTGLGVGLLILQGIATSIDALSVGFTIESYDFKMALAESLIIAFVTFGISIAGVFLGKRFGTRLGGKANILGGVILIAIGLEIFIGSFL